LLLLESRNMNKNLPEINKITTDETLSLKIKSKITEIAQVADEFPGVILIHDMRDLSIVYMSPRGVQQLGTTLEELVTIGPAYYYRYFNPKDAEEYVPKMKGLLERNKEQECITLFQQVRISGPADWTWHLTSVKILMRDETDKPLLTLGFAIPVDPEHHITNKVSRLLDENNFLRKNFQQFSKLSKREKEILRLMTLGKSSAEIAADLFISTTTAETHRRNIRQKLKADTGYELSQYARAFDLI